MNNIFHRIWHIIRIPFWIILALYIGVVIYRIPAAQERLKTEKVVKEIQSQKLNLPDVLGKNLPPEPDSKLKDATVEGIDANNNGIRDDVELAIFKLHPDSARIRAAELQYAMELQSEIKWVFNSDTWIAAVEHEGGIDCLVNVAFDEFSNAKDQINKSDEWKKEVDDLVFNTDLRMAKKSEIRGYETSVAIETKNCDVDIKKLPE